MALGDGVRRNIAHVSKAERDRFLTAIQKLANRNYPDGVSKWLKQDEIHQATHVHGGASFVPWHRELCNRLEELLREVDSQLSLHYWDWTEDPRAASDGSGGTVDLFAADFMGSGSGSADPPFGAGFAAITRNIAGGSPAPSPPGVDTDAALIAVSNGLPQAEQWTAFRERLEQSPNHNAVHGYIGGNIGAGHSAFEDPFVYLLHSNVDRLFALWQTQSGQAWRLDPDQVYGSETAHPLITEDMEPWAGASGLRPWAAPDNQQEAKNSKHPSVVAPPCYDTNSTFLPLVELVNVGGVVNFNDVTEDETAARAAVFRVYGCTDVTLRVQPGTEPAAPFLILSPGDQATAAHVPGEYVEGRLWFGFTGQTPSSTDGPVVVTIEVVETGVTFDVTLSANSIGREKVAVILSLDQSGSMDDDAGTTGSKRIELLRESATQFVDLVQAGNAVGVVRFDHDAYPVGDATWPGFAVTEFGTDSYFDPDRIDARASVASHATNQAGWTSIGDGVATARATIDPVTGFDHKALVVFTDGIENRDDLIEDVMGSIDDRTFAIGLGNESQVSTAALTDLTNGTGGYLLLTGSLTADIDDSFRLSKYFLQVLASATNTSVVTDPTGYLRPGQKVRIPFHISETDILCTPILLMQYPGICLAIETPAGDLITPGAASALGATYAEGPAMAHYRFNLPVGIGKGAHAGRWHAVLHIDDHAYKKLLGSIDNDRDAFARLRAHGIPFSFTCQAYSNLRLTASVSQASREPGSHYTIRARLTEYGIPIENRASVRVEIQRPDGSTKTAKLDEIEPGTFEAEQLASEQGVYRLRVLARGLTLRGALFEREELLTTAVLRGGDGPYPVGGGRVRQREEFCRAARCLLAGGALDHFLEVNRIDQKQVLRCLDEYCADDSPAGEGNRKRDVTAHPSNPKVDPSDMAEKLLEFLAKELDLRTGKKFAQDVRV